MAHVAKYNRAAVGHMFAHYERAKDSQGEYIKFGNQDINTEKSNLNYNLAPFRNISQGEFVRQRCSEVKCLKRKDVNVMCSWVVTAPEIIKEASADKQKEFFENTYSFLEKKYGEENIISAYVHNDENTPHLHFSFVPVFIDRHGKEKVSANDLLTRVHLKQFHPELELYLGQALGFNPGILNGATAGGNLTIEELKAKRAEEEYKNFINRYYALKAEVSEIEEIKNENQFLKDVLNQFNQREVDEAVFRAGYQINNDGIDR